MVDKVLIFKKIDATEKQKYKYYYDILQIPRCRKRLPYRRQQRRSSDRGERSSLLQVHRMEQVHKVILWGRKEVWDFSTKQHFGGK